MSGILINASRQNGPLTPGCEPNSYSDASTSYERFVRRKSISDAKTPPIALSPPNSGRIRFAPLPEKELDPPPEYTLSLDVRMHPADAVETNENISPSSFTRKLLRVFGKRSRTPSPASSHQNLSPLALHHPDYSLERRVSTGRTDLKSSLQQDRQVEFGLPESSQLRRVATNESSRYPPVAQRSSMSRSFSVPTRLNDPSFVEWDLAGAGARKHFRHGRSASADDDEDDGSGMAWVKKRKEERARRLAEENAANAAAPVDALEMSPKPEIRPVSALTAQLDSQNETIEAEESSDESEEEERKTAEAKQAALVKGANVEVYHDHSGHKKLQEPHGA